MSGKGNHRFPSTHQRPQLPIPPSLLPLHTENLHAHPQPPLDIQGNPSKMQTQETFKQASNKMSDYSLISSSFSLKSKQAGHVKTFSNVL
jgi:hypothetical protein